MIANKIVILAGAASLFQQVFASNSHRRLHRQAQKRDVKPDCVTVWHTIFVTAGEEFPATKPVAAYKPAPAATTTSTTIVVVPSAPVNKRPAKEPVFADPVPNKPTTPQPAAKPSKAPIFMEDQSKPQPKPKSEVESSNAPNGGSTGFHKRGIAYNDVQLANTFGEGCELCGWGYNWDSTSNNLDSKFSFVPMLWDNTPTHTDRFSDNVAKCLSDGAKAIFSFNEPDNGGQANMLPAAAAAAHAQWLNPYSGKALIGAPSVSNSGLPGEGLEWLKSFITACDAQEEKCAYDFCNLHWYSEVEYGETLFEHLDKAHKLCGKPIWLTEFAPFGSDDAITAWLKDAIPRLEELDYLQAYSYFSVAQGSLMSSTSSMSSYGQMYASA